MRRTRALIGHSGYVGTTLQRQVAFDATFRSTDIDRIRGRHFHTIVCAGAPAQKWLANADPTADRRGLEILCEALTQVTCDRFILVSTVDVFGQAFGVDEFSTPASSGTTAYGLHRRELEVFAQQHFETTVIRLPGLVGPGLRKNVVYDFLHDNDTAKIDSRARFQFYPMVQLWADISTSLDLGLDLVHLTAEPISVADVALLGFGIDFTNEISEQPASYDMRSRYAAAFGGRDSYQYSLRETVLALRSYAQAGRPPDVAFPLT